MQVIGFNLTKIRAMKSKDFQRTPMNTSIEFTGFEKEKVEMLKDTEAAKINFKFSVTYEDSKKEEEKQAKKKEEKEEKEKQGEVTFEGVLVLSVTKEEGKAMQKSWKKKQIPVNIQVPLYNFILKKCSIKAALIEEEIGLPTHIPTPQIKPSENQN